MLFRSRLRMCTAASSTESLGAGDAHERKDRRNPEMARRQSGGDRRHKPEARRGIRNAQLACDAGRCAEKAPRYESCAYVPRRNSWNVVRLRRRRIFAGSGRCREAVENRISSHYGGLGAGRASRCTSLNRLLQMDKFLEVYSQNLE